MLLCAFITISSKLPRIKKTMGIKLESYGKKPEYNTDEYLKKFIPLVIKHAPEYDNFSIRDLMYELNLSKTEEFIFSDLTFKIRQYFVSNGIAEMYGSNQIKLLDKGRDIKSGKEKIFDIIINNNFNYSTIGQLNQSSEKIDLKSPITQKIVHKTDKKPSKKSLIEIFAWIIGIIAGIVAIYEFIIKEFIN